MRGRSAFVPALVALVSWSTRASAGGSDLDDLLNQGVVTGATSNAEVTADAPATTTVITSDALQKYGVRTLAEALDVLALGTMSGINGSGFGDMGARGVTIAASGAKHFLLLIDGVRVNDVMNGSAPLGRASGVPLEIVDHIEVILGPGSVLYGSNAMLGVINVVTKDAKDLSGARVGVESEVATSVRPFVTYGHSFEIGSIQGQTTTEVEYYRQWGPSLYEPPAYGGTDPATGQPYRYTFSPTGTGVWGGADTLTLSQVENLGVTGRLRLGRFELDYNGGVSSSPTSVVASDFDTNAPTVNRHLILNLAYADQLTSVVGLRARTYLNAGDSDTTFYSSWVPNCPDPSINCRLSELQESIVGGAELTPTLDWLHDGRLVTLVGADAEVRSGRSVLNEVNDATGAPVLPSYGLIDHQDAALAGYAQQTWDPAPWVGFNAAGRLDYDPRFSPVVSPRFAARVDPWEGGTLKVIYSQAFRAPSFYESYFSHPLQPTSVGLKPEYEQSVEGSVEQRFAGQRVLFGVFATRWTDLINYYTFTAQEAAQYVAQGKAFLPPAYIERNLSAINNWGLNATFEGSRAANAIQYGLNVTAAVAFDEEPNVPQTPLPVSPRVFGNAHISYDLPGVLPTIALAASAETPRPIEGAFTSGFVPSPYSPAQLVGHATMTGSIPWVRGLSYRLSGYYAATDREPYRTGPLVAPSLQTPTPSLVPIDRARLMAGLTYEF